jgi:hypothetical protein
MSVPYYLLYSVGCRASEPVFLNVYGAQESILRHQYSLYSLAGRYDYPIPTRCLAPIDFLKIPALYRRNDFEAGNIHYKAKGHCKGWALEEIALSLRIMCT